jgi:hypothetical protein
MYELRIDQIQVLEELQSRASTHWEHVDELVELLQSGGQFKEPPVVFRQGPDRDEYFLADGFHRVHAYKKAGIESAIFDVRAGGTTAFRHAKLYSIQSNITHGLRRSNADKRRAVEMLLADEEWSTKSERWIAETAGVHHSTVQAIKQLAESASSTSTGTSSPKTGKDGKKRLTQNKPPAKKSGPTYHCELRVIAHDAYHRKRKQFHLMLILKRYLNNAKSPSGNGCLTPDLIGRSHNKNDYSK